MTYPVDTYNTYITYICHASYTMFGPKPASQFPHGGLQFAVLVNPKLSSEHPRAIVAAFFNRIFKGLSSHLPTSILIDHTESPQNCD